MVVFLEEDISAENKFILNQKEVYMVSEYQRIINGEKVKCNICGVGYWEQINKDVPKEDSSAFICTYCGERMNVTKKLKKWY